MNNSVNLSSNDINIGMEGNNTAIQPQNVPIIPSIPSIPAMSNSPNIPTIPSMPSRNHGQSMQHMLAQQHAILMRSASAGIPPKHPQGRGTGTASNANEQPLFPDFKMLEQMQFMHSMQSTQPPTVSTVSTVGPSNSGGIGGIPTMPMMQSDTFQSSQIMNHHHHHQRTHKNVGKGHKHKPMVSLQSITRDTQRTFNRHTHKGLNLLNQQCNSPDPVSSAHIAMLQNRLRQLQQRKMARPHCNGSTLSSPPKLQQIAERKCMMIPEPEKLDIMNMHRFEVEKEEKNEYVGNVMNVDTECVIGDDEKINDEMKREQVEVEEKKEMFACSNSNLINQFKLKLMSHSKGEKDEDDDALMSVIGNRVYQIPTIEELAATTDLFNNPLQPKSAGHLSSLRGYSVGLALRKNGSRRLINSGLKRSKTTFEPRRHRATLSRAKQTESSKIKKDTSEHKSNHHQQSQRGSPQSTFSLYAMKDPAVSRRVRKLSNNISLSRKRSYSCGALGVVEE